MGCSYQGELLSLFPPFLKVQIANFQVQSGFLAQKVAAFLSFEAKKSKNSIFVQEQKCLTLYRPRGSPWSILFLYENMFQFEKWLTFSSRMYWFLVCRGKKLWKFWSEMGENGHIYTFELKSHYVSYTRPRITHGLHFLRRSLGVFTGVNSLYMILLVR